MIKHIEIDGYRLLDGFKADFGSLTVVIGANAVGKSTLLDCLHMISLCAELPLNTVIDARGGGGALKNASDSGKKFGWKVTFCKPENPLWAQLPMDDNQALHYEVALLENGQGKVQAHYELLRTSTPSPGYTDAFKFLEATPHRRNIHSRSQRKLVPFDEAVPAQNLVKEHEDSNSSPVNLPVSAQNPALLLSQIRFFNEFPIPSSARALLANLAFYPGFDVGRFSKLRTKAAEIQPITTLHPNGENLGTVLHEILTRFDFRSVAEDLRAFLRAAYPAFEEIHCDTTFGTPPQVLVRIREKGMKRSMELWELSDGMLRFLCLVSALLNPLPPPFISLDEPESGLHPRLMPVVADMIKTAAERTQVLVTTHNPDLLKCFDIREIAVMAREDGAPKTRWHRPASRDSLVQMLKAVGGDTLGDLHRSGELEAME